MTDELKSPMFSCLSQVTYGPRVQAKPVDCGTSFYFSLVEGRRACVPQGSKIGAEITLFEKGLGNSGDNRTASPSKLETVTFFSVRLCESQL